jgi:Uma2 family endonuclease
LLIAPPTKPTGEKRLTFRGLDWSAFKQVTQLLQQQSRARFSYGNGVLEITIPLEGHERSARLIELFIRILVVELGLKIKTMGSTTLERADLLKSAEPDNGYYIQNYALVADHEIDLNSDPAPDLVVEVDIAHTDLNKNAHYASLGVREFWRFNGQTWQILKLVEGDSIERDLPLNFPMIAKSDLYQFLEVALVDEVTAETNLRQWVRQQVQA